MSEREHESQLSALFDDQLPADQADLVIRRALKDPALRATWGRYALIGACIRNEPVRAAAGRRDVAERVRLALAAEPELVESSPVPQVAGSRRSWAMFGRGALGGAIAAGVAVIAVGVMRSAGPDATAPAMQIAAVAPVDAPTAQFQPSVEPARVETPARMVAVAADTAPRSYTTPVDNSPRRMSQPLSSLVVAHSEVAAAAMRIVPLGGSIGGGYDVTQGAVDMTEAEIGAYR